MHKFMNAHYAAKIIKFHLHQPIFQKKTFKKGKIHGKLCVIIIVKFFY